MKRILGAVLPLAVLAAIVIVATTSEHRTGTAYAATGCTDASLKGGYGVIRTGFGSPPPNTNGPSRIPVADLALGAFDGAGNFSATVTDVKNGDISTNIAYTATYTVNSDCTVSFLSTNGGNNFGGVIVNGGAEVLAIDLTPSQTVIVDFKKQ